MSAGTAWPMGAGEMARRIREHDWAATPLGAIETWPQSLRSTVAMLVVHGFPMVALWGPELIQIYNDGYRTIMADKHPAGLGQPTAQCWPEVQHINGPIYERVRAGETVTFEDALYPLARHGPLENAWFTLTFSPLRDDDDAIAGVLVTVFETTEKHIADGRRNKSDALLRIALEGGGMGAWRWDLANRLVSGDARFLALWGFPPSDELHPLALFTERMSRDSAAEMEVVVTRAIEAGEEFDGQVEIVSGPTAGRWVRWRGRADLGDPSTLYGTSFDVTEQRRSERALRDSEERFRAFVTASSDAVYRMGPDWSEMRQLVGQSFLADTSEPSTAWLDRYIQPADHARVRSAIERALRDKTRFELEHRVIRADGSDGWAVSRAVPIFDAVGEITEWLGTASDVTERKRREADAALLDEVGQILARLSEPGEIMQAVGVQVGRYLHLSSCHFCDVDDALGKVTVHRGWTVDRVPALEQTYDWKDFLTEDFGQASRNGEMFVVCDVARDRRADPKPYAAVKIGSFVAVPFLSGARWVAYLAANDDAPRSWRDDELALLKEMGERLFGRVEQARAEAALRASETKYRNLFENMTEGYGIGELIRDAAGRAIDCRFVELNPALERHTGMSRVAAIGHWFSELFPDTDRSYWLDLYQAVVDTKSVRSFETYWPPIDRWIGGVASPADNGRFYVLYRNITDRKRQELAIQESEARLAADLLDTRALQEAGAAMIEDLREDEAETRILAAALTIMRADAASLQRFDPESGELVLLGQVGFHPAAAAFWERVGDASGGTCAQSMSQRTRVVVQDVQEDQIIRSSEDLGYFQLSGIVAMQTTPLITRSGRLIGMLSTHWHERHRPDDRRLGHFDVLARQAADLIERRATEAALRESEERFRQFGEASQDVLWIRDAETFQWEYLTPAFETVYGLGRETALGGDNMANWLQLIVPEDRERAAASIERVRDGAWVTFEYRIRHGGDGEMRWLRNTDFPIRDATGRVVRIGGIGHDITDEKRAEERQQVLVAELQHRTFNLLSVVGAMANTTIQSSTSLDEFERNFRDRVDALARVQRLLSRLREGHRISFDELIVGELTAAGALQQDTGHVTLEGPSGVALRSSTVQTFALALHELTTNAVKYGALKQPDARLHIRWHVEDGEGDQPWLHVAWNETGVVMPRAGATGQGTGQGRTLIEKALPYQLRARTSYELAEDGVRCTIALPVSRNGLDRENTHV